MTDKTEQVPATSLVADEKYLPELEVIVSFLHQQTNHDFHDYKNATLLRRIQRRMQLHHVEKASDYVEILRLHPAEVQTLLKEFMVGVTRFFRNPEAFQTLQELVLRPLLENAEPTDTLRIWVPGCSTGEEAYSLAILLHEQRSILQKQCRFQIIATDINGDALEKARAGVYSENIASDISRERLQRFFIHRKDSHIVDEALRENIIFTTHNLLSELPFCRMDLISCRNLLIYFKPLMQSKLQSLFQFSLRPGGYLFLGDSEGINEHAGSFETISKPWRIFRRSHQAVQYNPRDLPGASQRSSFDSESDLQLFNEELQAMNEELQVSQEELQSLNEELHTLNAQLREKIEELETANNDLSNLFGSTEIATIFLDPSLRIKRFTPAACQLFHLLPVDLGRPLGDLAPKFEDPHLLANAQTVFQHARPIEKEIQAYDGRWLIRRILPYRTSTQSIEGVILTFIDITERKHAEDALRQLASIVQFTNDAIIGKNLDGTITSWNRGAEKLYGYRPEEALGQNILLIIPEEYHTEWERLWEQTMSGQPVSNHETVRRRRDGSLITVSLTFSPILDDAGRVCGASAIARDVTEHKKAEKKFRSLLESAPDAMLIVNEEGRIHLVNQRLEQLFGYQREELLGQPVEILMPEQHRRAHVQYRTLYQTNPRVRPMGVGVELYGLHKNGEMFPIEVSLSPIPDSHGERLIASGIRDISERKKSGDLLKRRVQQQEAVASLGQYALTGMDFDELMSETANLLHQTLGLERVALAQWVREREELVMHTSAGWNHDMNGVVESGNPRSSPALYAFFFRRQVIMEQLAQESRFSIPSYLTEEGISSGVVVVIPGPGQPHGTLCVYSQQPRQFASDEIKFLQTCANTLGIVLERKNAEQAQHESHERFRAIFDQAPVGIAELTWDGRFQLANRQLSELCGYNKKQLYQLTLHDLLAPNNPPGVQKSYEEILHGEQKSGIIEAKLLCHTQQTRWVRLIISHIQNTANRPPYRTIIFQDIEEHKKAEERQRLLTAELDHRVKNTLGIVSSIARESARRVQTLEEFNEVFGGRLIALTQLHRLLTQNRWEGAQLQELIELLAAPYVKKGGGPTLRLEGPPIALNLTETQTLHMAMHEMMTNAVKYGSFSTPEGVLTIRWDTQACNNQEELLISWVESDGPPVAPPQHKGFGSQLIQEVIGYQLDGQATIEYLKEGLRCTITFPHTSQANFT